MPIPSVPDQDPAGVAPAVSRPPTAADKVRVRFRKSGMLRLLGHQDLLRTFERLLRRAQLPVRHTHGFHPKPRIIFALSLPLGVIGCAEIVEIELDQPVPPDEVRARLVAQAPPGLDFLDVCRIDPRAGAQVRSLCYALTIPPDRLAELSRRCAEVLAATECRVERPKAIAHRPPRDIRPFVRDLRIVPLTEPNTDAGPATHPSPCVLEIDLWLKPGGTAHPQEVLLLLGLEDLLEAGCVVQRLRLELEDTPLPEKESHEKRDAD